MNPQAPRPATHTDPDAPGLIFDWKHRPRTWPKLTFWFLLVLIAHLAGFILFRVRLPPPARAMPVPATIILAPDQAVDPAELMGHSTLAGLLSPEETSDLDLPEHEPVEPHVPTFADHLMAREPWPSRPEPAAWPEVSQVSQPVLPPATPAPPPSEGPAVPPQ